MKKIILIVSIVILGLLVAVGIYFYNEMNKNTKKENETTQIISNENKNKEDDKQINNENESLEENTIIQEEPEEMESPEELIVEFAKTYLSYDYESPMAYLEDSKDYLSRDLYREIEKGGIRRPPTGTAYIEINNIETHPSSDVESWTITVEQTLLDNEKKVIKNQNLIYLLNLVEIKDKWYIDRLMLLSTGDTE